MIKHRQIILNITPEREQVGLRFSLDTKDNILYIKSAFFLRNRKRWKLVIIKQA